ncbi:MAG: AIM24 family protein, partial [Bdellovibrionales bacterium]|nr:AIM24 family protein [Bdellovibrionales bacterium]
KERVAFAAPYPGKIIPLALDQLGPVLCQKNSYLCSAMGIDVNVAFTKRLGSGLFGGEGFILQKLTGDGLSFVHAGGTIHEVQLQAGEKLRVDTGCIVAFQESVEYNIEFVGSIRSALVGGEGLFFATLTGPGHVWLQSLPFSRLADRIYQAMPRQGGQQVGEGGILGTLLGGDR